MSIGYDVERWWDETYNPAPYYISPALAERVWVVNRCIQLNSQQIAAMPLRFEGTREPAWVSNPDPNWYPNGISDAIFASIRQIYGWGFVCLLVTSRYADGFPQSWTVLDSEFVAIGVENGRRTYKHNGKPLNPFDVVQIDRDPGVGLHGTSAIRAYATQAWGFLAAGELTRKTMAGGVPTSVIKSTRKLTAEQARTIQSQWSSAVTNRGGMPAVLPPELDFETLSFSPRDLLLLDALEFNARVLASAFGVPPFMLNLPLTGGLTYQNPAMLGEYWWRFELRTTGKRFSDALTSQMLPRGNFVFLDAADTFAPLMAPAGLEDDPQMAPTADATPASQPGVVAPIRPMEVTG
jgi:HK97 family phage portal protein